MQLAVLGLACIFSSAIATGPIPVSRTGLAGIDGFTFYKPYCGHACFRSFSPYMLSCSDAISAGGHTTADDAAHELAMCRASDFPYLSSIAWCIHMFCPGDVLASTIEHFWETQITGDAKVLPKRSYGETLALISHPPTEVAMGDDLVLNETMLTTHHTWKITQETLIYFFWETEKESYLGLSILLTAFGLPLVLTWLGYLPFMNTLLARIKPWLYPSLIGTYHDRPLPFSIGNVPTVGESFYIAVLLILNIVFLTVGYETLWPREEMQWYENHYQELMAYWMWRTGALAFCQMPILFLFSTRNNLLLWLTNWSHSTFMLLHRWIARFFLLQVLLHSIISLVLYIDTGAYATELGTPLWIWGCVATVAAVIIILTSFLIFRQKAYELFLITHIVLAMICVVGSWYHVWYDDEGQFGYATWLYATFAVWFSDRLIRVGRMVKIGIRRAIVTDISPGIARVDIPGVRGWHSAGQSAYLYFPSLRRSLRPWENHPFSMIPTPALCGPNGEDGSDAEAEVGRMEKEGTVDASSRAASDRGLWSNSGITFFIKKRRSMTASLKAQERLLVLVEGPYPTTPRKSLMRNDRLLLIGGGIGITGLVPYLRAHSNVKMFYSVKAADEGLVTHLRPVFDGLHEKQIIVGKRLDLTALLHEEAHAGWSNIAVVVCGPASMCDDTRAIVSQLGRARAGGCSFELAVDAFSW